MINATSKIKHLSFSSFSLYRECPYKFYRKYILGVRPTYEEPFFKIGKGFHKGMETLYKYKNLDRAIQDFLKYMGDDREIMQTQISNLIESMKDYYKTVFPKYSEINRGNEIRIEMRLPDIPLPIVGYIDNIFTNGFIDYKTTSYTQADSMYKKRQMYIYSLWFYFKYKQIPTNVQVHWFNKFKPKYGQVKVEVSMDDVMMVMAELKQFWKDIENERFLPNLDNWEEDEQGFEEALNYINDF